MTAPGPTLADSPLVAALERAARHLGATVAADPFGHLPRPPRDRAAFERLAGRLGLRVDWWVGDAFEVAALTGREVVAVPAHPPGSGPPGAGPQPCPVVLGPAAGGLLVAGPAPGTTRTLDPASLDGPRAWALLSRDLPAAGLTAAGRPGGDGHVLGGHGHDGHGGGGHGQGTGHGGGGHAHPHPFRRLVTFLRPEAGDVRIVVTFGVVTGLMTLAVPIAVESLVTSVAFGGLVQPVVVLALVLLVALAFAGAVRAAQAWVVELLQRRLFVRVLADLADRLPRVRFDALDGPGPEQVNRFFDVVKLQKTVAILLTEGVSVTLAGVVGMAVLAFYHPLLLAFDVVLVAAVLFVVFGLSYGGVRSSILESRRKYEAGAWLEELARHPATFKEAGGAALARSRGDAIARRWLDARGAHFRVVFRQLVGALALQALASTLLLGVGGWLVVAGQLTLGQLVAAELIVTAVVASVAKLGKHLESWYDLMAAVDKLGHLLDLPLDRAGGEPLPPASTGLAVTLRGVPTPGGPLDLALAPGERVAVVGPMGAGKSRLLTVLAALDEPGAGSALFDGQDVRSLDLPALRTAIALARPNEVVEGTVLENLRLARPGLELADATRALEASGLAPVVRALPRGLDEPLSVGGAPLSREQANLLVLARALAARPRLLLVDAILDRVSVDERAAALVALTAPDAPWTLVAATCEPDVAAACGRVVRLEPGGGATAPVHA